MGNGRRHIRRLQAFSDVAPDRDSRHAVAPAHDGLLGTDFDGPHLRQRNALPVRAGQREVAELGRVKPEIASGASDDLHAADVLPHHRDRHAVEQELQLLRHRAGAEADRLQAVLLQVEMQRRDARVPVRIHRAHQRTGIHHPLHFGGDPAQHLGVGTADAVGHRIRRVGTEDELRHAQLGLGREAVGDGPAQAQLQGLALVLAVRPDDDLRERGIGQLRAHREVEARCALADVGGHDLGLALLGQPGFDLRRGAAGLGDRRAIGHLHLDQDLRTVRDREELLLHRAHAQHRQHEQSDDRSGNQPLARDDPAQHAAEALVVRRAVERVMPALDALELRQHLHAEVGREDHCHHP